MNLQRQHAFQRAAGGIVIDTTDRLEPVEPVFETVAAGDDAIIVPILLLVVSLRDELLLRRELTHDLRLAVLADLDLLAHVREVFAAFLVVEESDLALLVFNLRLIAADYPFAEILAAILDAGISVADAKLEPQLEVLEHAAAPDEERVALRQCGERRLATQDAILHGPEARVAIPARKVAAGEDWLEISVRGPRSAGQHG